jgi:nucleotide-binding universal stress UspA family protein
MPEGDKVPIAFKRVLLATQGTEFDAGAERVGIELAARSGIELLAVAPVVSNAEYESLAPLLGDEAESSAAARLGELRERAQAAGVKLAGTVRRGEEPYREIVEEARVQKADLIVLRRRGKRGFLANLLLGEMVHTVTGHAPCDVLIVPRASRLWSRSIVLATDGSPHSQKASLRAASIAAAFGLPMAVVTVAEDDAAAKDAAAIRVEQALKTIRAAGVQAQGRVLTGRPYEAILRAAHEDRADLIVLGRRGLNPVRKLLVGSTSEQVAGRSNDPVLIVHAPTG